MVSYSLEPNGICPYKNYQAKHFWSKACNFHRGSDKKHVCGNPDACERRLIEAWTAELSGQELS